MLTTMKTQDRKNAAPKAHGGRIEQNCHKQIVAGINLPVVFLALSSGAGHIFSVLV
jgi:hypothetical protein